MALTSPGVEVKVIDESFYTPAEPGTVPLIIVTSAENKQNGGGTGIAPGTLKANAGTVYLLTSQKDLADTFGDPVFKTDANNNPVHAGEQNEYGLQAAYSLLGVSNRAYVVRADLDLDAITPSASEPTADPSNGTHWVDTDSTRWGIFEWNGAPASTTGGQKFTNKVPRIINSISDIGPTGGPKSTLGVIGDYAIVTADDSVNTPALATTHPLTVWYKSKGHTPSGLDAGTWVEVGSEEWSLSWPVVTSSVTTDPLTPGNQFRLNGNVITISNTSLSDLADDINNANVDGISAAVVNNKLEIYSSGAMGLDPIDSSLSNEVNIEEVEDPGNPGEPYPVLADINITPGLYYAPRLQISKHTQVPEWKRNNNLLNSAARPTGSVWVKTTDPNLGAKISLKRWNSVTKAWEVVAAPVFDNGQAAIFNLDRSGGGANIAVGTCYVKANYDEDNGTDASPRKANYKFYRKSAAGATTIKTKVVDTGVFSSGSKTFYIAESIVGSDVLGDYDITGTYSSKTVTWTAANDETDSDSLASAINSAGLQNVEASVDAANRVVISHLLGGEMRFAEGSGNTFTQAGFASYNWEPSDTNPTTGFGTGTANLSAAPSGDNINDWVASLWHPLVYVINNDAPGSLTEDGTLWYNSVVDEVDILIHDGVSWIGYHVPSPGNPVANTDNAGPLVSATAPEKQSDGTALVTGDLWIDTSDLENFPVIYKYNDALAAGKKWVLVDTSDQTTEDGILFADARWSVNGIDSNEPATIASLLESDYVDPDAPDPALYPKGMLLWNTRRSGFNVKRFVRNYIDVTADNTRYGDESMIDYYPHRWVTESPNQADGTASLGRKAQRAVVVKALQATVNSNQQIRDEESRVFNLIACPGYPELIGELVTLNTDRGLTAFVIGDSPARLTSDATSLLEWASNANGAVEDNDVGAVSYDEYMAMFYPWGFTSDNFGNNIVVPPSHMMLRTIALNDQVAYPWFAPAGVRRGGITNATAVGFVTSEGEFSSVALNTGQRDTLYEQKVNPLTFLTGTGLVNYGQKTRAKAASALDRINVARLVVYLRRQLNSLAKPYIFEPNDKITRDEIKAAVESLLLELVGQRAIYDYIVVCDESNNTPSRIDRNELYIDIAIEPVKAVEFIYIPLRLKNTGEIASLG
jgi:Phage tail sheath C-terminal domain